MWQFFCWESFVYLFIYSNIRTKRPLKMCIRTTVQVIKSVSYSCVPWQAEVWCAIFRGWHQYTDNAGRWVRYSRERKGKEAYLYIAIYILCISQSAQAWITQCYLQIHHACLSFVSVHQMAPFLTEIEDIQLQLTTHLLTLKGWKAELAWLVDPQRTVYPHKWSPVSYRSSSGQESLTAKDRRSTTEPRNQPRS